VDVTRLEQWQNEGVSFEGLKVMSGEDRQESPVKEATPQNWSTHDFLNLRFSGQQREQGSGAGLGQNSSKEGLPGLKKAGVRGEQEIRDSVAFLGVMNQLPLVREGVDRQTLEAPVMRASSGQIRLSDEAVGSLTGVVNGLSQARQDGEIKIRLKPDHLGELVMNVRTQGQQVSLQIKATDGESKKILEDSLSALRDSLSQQNLSLSKVEVVSAPAQSFTAPDQNPNQMSDSGAQRQGFGGESGGFSGNGSDRESGQERRFEESVAGGNLNLSRAGRSVRNRSASGLDLIA
jgi:flagellar hook-length control protein FliK